MTRRAFVISAGIVAAVLRAAPAAERFVPLWREASRDPDDPDPVTVLWDWKEMRLLKACGYARVRVMPNGCELMPIRVPTL